MPRTLAQLMDDIIYESHLPVPRPHRIRSIAREAKRKFPELAGMARGPVRKHEAPGCGSKTLEKTEYGWRCIRCAARFGENMSRLEEN